MEKAGAVRVYHLLGDGLQNEVQGFLHLESRLRTEDKLADCNTSIPLLLLM